MTVIKILKNFQASATKEAVFIDVRNITTPYISIRSQLYQSKYLAISGTGSVRASTDTKNDDVKFTFDSAK